MFFGLTIEKLLLIGVVAAFVVGPERLPRYAQALAQFTKQAREWLSTAKTRVRDEMGDDFEDLDWRSLDPRQYDPRRIIREALLDDAPVPARVTPTVESSSSEKVTTAFVPGGVPPFDSEST
jgi:sec-independent protein translocase protein TatB